MGSKKSIEWMGRCVAMANDGDRDYSDYIENVELGLREDGVLVWREKQTHGGAVVVPTTHKVRKCDACGHRHPKDVRCRKKINDNKICMCKE